MGFQQYFYIPQLVWIIDYSYVYIISYKQFIKCKINLFLILAVNMSTIFNQIPNITICNLHKLIYIAIVIRFQ